MRLYCLAYGDGALIGATADDDGADYGYWAYRFERDDDGNPYEDWCLFSVTVKDTETANRLMNHGTPDQWYSDGYEAFAEVEKWGSRQVLIGNGGKCDLYACFPWID